MPTKIVNIAGIAILALVLLASVLHFTRHQPISASTPAQHASVPIKATSIALSAAV